MWCALHTGLFFNCKIREIMVSGFLNYRESSNSFMLPFCKIWRGGQGNKIIKEFNLGAVLSNTSALKLDSEN